MMIVIRVILTIAVVYLVLIMPRVIRRPDRSIFKSKFFAHRGLFDNATDAPENSLNAFRRAVDKGFGIELDIQMTKDKVPVVFHDFTLRRVTGQPGKVSDYTFDELQKFCLCGQESAKIPRFVEVLSLVAGKVPLIVEYKVEKTDLSICRAGDAQLTSYGGPYCVESFNPLVLLWYRVHHTNVVRGQLSDGFLHQKEFRGKLAPGAFLLQFLLFNIFTAPDFIAYNVLYPDNPSRRIDKALYRCKQAAWTVKSPAQLRDAASRFDVFIFEGFLPAQTGENNNIAG